MKAKISDEEELIGQADPGVYFYDDDLWIITPFMDSRENRLSISVDADFKILPYSGRCRAITVEEDGGEEED